MFNAGVELSDPVALGVPGATNVVWRSVWVLQINMSAGLSAFSIESIVMPQKGLLLVFVLRNSLRSSRASAPLANGLVLVDVVATMAVDADEAAVTVADALFGEITEELVNGSPPLNRYSGFKMILSDDITLIR